MKGHSGQSENLIKVVVQWKLLNVITDNVII
jgi:hypothetical protein